jgi:chromosome transmission fidelity protein 1
VRNQNKPISTLSLFKKNIDLIPTLLSLSTTRLLYTTLVTALEQVCGYVSRFRTRLSAINVLHLKRLVVFLDALKKYLGEWKKARANETLNAEVISVAQLIDRMGKKVAGINLLEIETYLKRSKAC